MTCLFINYQVLEVLSFLSLKFINCYNLQVHYCRVYWIARPSCRLGEPQHSRVREICIRQPHYPGPQTQDAKTCRLCVIRVSLYLFNSIKDVLLVNLNMLLNVFRWSFTLVILIIAVKALHSPEVINVPSTFTMLLCSII